MISRWVWCLIHGVGAFFYITGGSVQTVGGIIFSMTFPIFRIGSNVWTGVSNIFIGLITLVFCFFGQMTRCRVQALLYLGIFGLIVNAVNLTVVEAGEWWFYKNSTALKNIERRNLTAEVHHARIFSTVTSAVFLLLNLLHINLAYFLLEFYYRPSSKESKCVNEAVSDTEYIIPRKKSFTVCPSKPASTTNFTQSWVFDSEMAVCSLGSSPVVMYPSARLEVDMDDHACNQHYTSPPVVRVQVDEARNERDSGDRQINHMKSFSRTPSPADASHSTSSSSIPPFHECLERLTQPVVYRSRLNSYKNVKDPSNAPSVKSRCHSGDHDHYASLVVELESSFCHRKDPKTTVCVVPSASKLSTTCNESVAAESLDSRQRGSDAEFSKELEAALKLIQDLESPNTIDTPSEKCKSPSEPRKRSKSRRDKNDSDSSKSGCSSLDAHGKNHSGLPVESQSTSGYNSPSLDRFSRLTPTADLSSCDLTSSQENGLSCVIRHMGDTAVISLFSPSKQPHPYASGEKMSDVGARKEYDGYVGKEDARTKSLNELKMRSMEGEEKLAKGRIRRWRHLIERKRRPSLLPEVESAIMKSESLAFLSKRELEDRLNETKSIHRKIEQKVHRQRSLRRADSFGSVEDIIDRYGAVSTCL